MANKVVDLILVYQFIRRLVMPFDKTEAYKLGLIDKDGKRTKEPLDTKEKQEAYSYFNRLIFNIKRLIETLPGGKSKIASYAAALFLIKEGFEERDYSDKELTEGLEKAMSELDENTKKTMKDLFEDAPANVTGAGVAGTGDDPVHWKRLDGRKKQVKDYIKQYMLRREKREKIKKRDELRKLMGL
jgi:hypothetical protein